MAATLSDSGTPLSSDHIGDRSAFVASHGASGSSRGGRDSRRSGRTGGRKSRKCTHCVSVLIV
jgi:hypothetical protein